MKKTFAALLALAALAASANASAATWTSLGRVNALTALPDTANCQQRIVNHYWSSKPIHYPNVINTYNPGNIQFVFDLDLRSLRTFTSNSVANSRFKTAIDSYVARTEPAKSIHAAVSVGEFPRVSLEVSYVDTQGLTQGLGYGVIASELQYYEVQQLCPL